MARVLVTGGTGFVGSHLVRRLVGQGHDVTVATRDPADPARRTAAGAAALVAADLRDPTTAPRLLDQARPEQVFHLAGAVMQGGRPQATREIAEVTLLGTVALLQAAATCRVERCVVVGDAFEYGPGDGPVAESAVCTPTTLDGVAKLGATLVAQQLARDAGFPVVVVRLFSVFGPGDAPRRLVSLAVSRALDGVPIPLTDRGIVRDYLFVDDAVELLLAAAEAAPELRGAVVNGGTGRATTLGEIVDCILRVTGSASDAQWGALAPAAHDAHHPVADIGLARARIGWSPRVDLETGIRAVVQDELSRRLARSSGGPTA